MARWLTSLRPYKSRQEMATRDHSALTDKRPPISKLELVLICGIVLLAAWLRFNHIDQAEFLWDQSEISRWGLRMAQERRIVWIGPISSTGVGTFPMAIWLYAIPYAFSSSPVVATGFVALLNLLAVIGCYFLTRHWFGGMAALVATLLYAVAPWAVIYSRKIWHTVLMPPIVMLYITTGWLAFVRGRRWALVAHTLALAMLVHTHLTSLPFILLTVLWAFIFCKRIDWRLVPISIVIGMLTFVPYLITDAGKDWRNVRGYIALAQEPSSIRADAIHAAWAITTGYDLHHLTGLDLYQEFLATTPNIRWLFAALGLGAILGIALALWRTLRRARRGLNDETAAALMAATWMAMPVLFLTRYSQARPVAPHYFTTTLPAQFILIGWIVGQVGRLKGHLTRICQAALIILVMVLAATQAYEFVSVLRFVMTRETAFGGYGTPVAYEIQAVETAKHLGQEIGSEEVIVLSLGDEPRMYEMPNAAHVLMYNHPHRAVDIQTAVVFPEHPAVYWVTYEMSPGEELLATYTPEITDARIPLREGIRSFRFYRWPGGKPDIPCLQPLPDGPATWANGARLVGYCIEGEPKPGGTIHWMLVWQPTQSPTEDVYYHWFNHVLDEDGEMRGQKDGPSMRPAYWRAGDTVINWFEIPITPDSPGGQLSMRVGMYTIQPGTGTFLGNIPLQGTDDTEPLILELPPAR
jgi:4-amino-4-deoxy-L-arabinose transferase-like glycosyltransferase